MTWSSRKQWMLVPALLLIFAAGCDAIRPARAVPAEDQAPLFMAPTFSSAGSGEEAASTPTQQQASAPVSGNCTNDLTFISDLNYPDGTQVSPGSIIEKQWKITNSGTCDWDSTYSLRLTLGDAMGAPTQQALVPARNGTEAVVNITFSAPLEGGTYSGTWKAYDPNGEPFGDYFSIEINVTTP